VPPWEKAAAMEQESGDTESLRWHSGLASLPTRTQPVPKTIPTRKPTMCTASPDSGDQM
jgi:hypothetical protein